MQHKHLFEKIEGWDQNFQLGTNNWKSRVEKVASSNVRGEMEKYVQRQRRDLGETNGRRGIG